METVQFQCGSCRKLMAVAKDHLGQQVRCPHCQQVVLAPAPAPDPQPAPAPTPAVPDLPAPLFTPPATDHEDIFSPQSESDSLFDEPAPVRLELPPAAAPPAPNGLGDSVEPVLTPAPVSYWPPHEPAPPAPAAEVPPPPPEEPTFPWSPAPSDAAPATFPTEAALQAPAAEAPAAAPSLGEAVTAAEPAPEELAGLAAAPATSDEVSVLSVRRPPREGGGWFIPLVFVPLVLYAVGATFFIGWSILKLNQMQEQQQQQNLFDTLPDDGDSRGVTKDGRRISARPISFPERYTTGPLPEQQRLKLGEMRRFGVLEVTPVRVARKRVAVLVDTWPNAQPCKHDSLVLTLKLRNVSDDQTFAPLDNYFDRHWKPGQGPVPLTHLVAGSHRLCGPARWNPPGGKDKTEWVQGRHRDLTGLKPGEEQQGFVCTDGDDPVAARALFGEKGVPAEPGPFLWRVRLRRGLIDWNGQERSATTVIGVEFPRSAIEMGANG
jgi:hypothetical protein